MLNITDDPACATPQLDARTFRAIETVGDSRSAKKFARAITTLLVLLFLFVFLPWTQNIRARGVLTGLDPEMRPQTIHAIIPGRIEQWYVQEGQKVMRGDTIMRISEVKQEYFDPMLLERTGQQINAKEMTARSYQEKVNALDAQIDALNQAMRIKLEQARNRILQAKLQIASDSIRVVAARMDIAVARDQLERGEEMFQAGLISVVELERRRMNEQRGNANMIDAENDLLDSRNKLLNAELDLGGITNEYRDKLAKAGSEKYASLSQLFTTEAEVSKMQVDLAGYTIREGNYYITAPQSG
jgi:multidrug resistance efflux pump